MSNEMYFHFHCIDQLTGFHWTLCGFISENSRVEKTIIIGRITLPPGMVRYSSVAESLKGGP
jgi:hypothetical protein